MDTRDHWKEVYGTRSSGSLSWYQASPEESLKVIERQRVPKSASIIDVGGGASSLVDSLLLRGWSDLTVLDLAEEALAVARARLSADAAKVRWIAADVTNWTPQRRYDVWHDRAVFHFLAGERQREAYRRSLQAGVSQGGLVILATFAPDGPASCSGLPVRRYDAAGLAWEIGPEFRTVETFRQVHLTPSGKEQPFTWAIFRRSLSSIRPGSGEPRQAAEHS